MKESVIMKDGEDEYDLYWRSENKITHSLEHREKN